MSQTTKLKSAGCSMNRCLAAFIDNILSSVLCCVCYGCWKDSYRGGKSFGKGAMGLRVVKLNGSAPTCVDSCVRNICMSFPGGLGCLCVFFNEEKRHMGDLIAGTMVIEDS